MKTNLIKINIFIFLILLSFGCNKNKHVSGTNYNLSMQIPKKVKGTSAKANPLFQEDELAPVITIKASEDSFVEHNKDLKVIDENLEASILKKIGSKIFVDKAAIDSFYVGQILMSDITDYAPLGFLVKVESIKKNKDYAILNVKDATLDDAFDRAKINVNNTMCTDCAEDSGDGNEPDSYEVKDCTVISLNQYLPKVGRGTEVELDEFNEFDNGSSRTEVSARWWFYAKPSANLIIAFHVIQNIPGERDKREIGLGLQLPKVKPYENNANPNSENENCENANANANDGVACGDGDSEADISLGFETTSYQQWEHPAQLVKLPTIRILVGGVPFIFENKGGFGGLMTLESSMKAALNIDLYGSFMTGASIEKNRWGIWKDIKILTAEHFQCEYGIKKPGWEIVESGFHFGSEFNLWPYMELETTLWRVIGVTGRAGPSINCTVDVCGSLDEEEVSVNLFSKIGIAAQAGFKFLWFKTQSAIAYYGPWLTYNHDITVYSRNPEAEPPAESSAADCQIDVPEPIPDNRNYGSKVKYGNKGLNIKNTNNIKEAVLKSGGGFMFDISNAIGGDGGFTFKRNVAANVTNKFLAYKSNTFQYLTNATTFHLRHAGGSQYQIILKDPDKNSGKIYVKALTGGKLGLGERNEASLFIITDTDHLTILPIEEDTSYQPCPGADAGKRDISEAEGTLGSSTSMADDIAVFLEILTDMELCPLRTKLVQRQPNNQPNLTNGQIRKFRDDFCNLVSGRCRNIEVLQKFNNKTGLVDAWEIPNRHEDDISKNVEFVEILYGDISNPQFPNSSIADADDLKAALGNSEIFNFYKRFYNSRGDSRRVIGNKMRERYLEAITLNDADKRIDILESVLHLKTAIRDIAGMNNPARASLSSSNLAFGEASFASADGSYVLINFVSVSGTQPTRKLNDLGVTEIWDGGENWLLIPLASDDYSERFFPPAPIDQNRAQDSEAKIIEYIMNAVASERIGEIVDPESDSTINAVLNGANLKISIFSEMEACSSCSNIIRAFNTANPNNITFSGGTNYYEQPSP